MIKVNEIVKIPVGKLKHQPTCVCAYCQANKKIEEIGNIELEEISEDEVVNILANIGGFFNMRDLAKELLESKEFVILKRRK